jgi:hypothetical protein
MITVTVRESAAPYEVKAFPFPHLFPEQSYSLVLSGIRKIDAISIEEQIASESDMVITIRFMIRRRIFGRNMFRYLIKRYIKTQVFGSEYQLRET